MSLRRSHKRPLIAVTSGDPCGIGPEVILKVLRNSPAFLRRARLVVVGDLPVFAAAARRMRIPLPAWSARSGPWLVDTALSFWDCGHRGVFAPGKSTAAAGAASLAYIDNALSLGRLKDFRALVTAPVTKWAISRTRPGFVGQTEYLGKALDRRDLAMLFISDSLRIVLVTRHVPYAAVPRALTRELLRKTIVLTVRALREQFAIPQPRIALCGLNPHAGEGGLFGKEEREVLLPVMRALRRSGIRCEGPFAADGFFAGPVRADVVVCGYHDQGLIPFKMAARDRGCQMTAGLPIVRTSPDHGSALDIAGRGVADSGSMEYALKLAVDLAC